MTFKLSEQVSCAFWLALCPLQPATFPSVCSTWPTLGHLTFPHSPVICPAVEPLRKPRRIGTSLSGTSQAMMVSSQANTDLYNWAFGSEPCDSLAMSAQAVVRKWLCSCPGLVPKCLSLPWPMPGVVLPPLKSHTGNLLLEL